MFDASHLEVYRETANQLVSKLNAVEKSGPVAVAIELIARRIVSSGDSLTVLQQNSPHDFGFDAASILRNIYDVMLQGLYIMAKSDRREERAQLYLDFMDVERVQKIELIDGSDTPFAKALSQSHKRAEAEPAIRQRFGEVRDKFTTRKGGLRACWYPDSLRNLAIEAGFESEYGLIQRFLSGVVHSSPLTLREGPFVRGQLLLVWHWWFAFRILGAYAEYAGVKLDDVEQGLIEHARQNVFAMTPDKRSD